MKTEEEVFETIESTEREIDELNEGDESFLSGYLKALRWVVEND